MKFNFFLKSFIIGILILSIASCDRDINEIGGSIVGDNHYGLNHTSFDVLAYNQSLGPVQTNNLPVNQLGVYYNPVFGKTTASFVTQVSLSSANPTFINSSAVVLDSVYLYVPYFATLQSTTSDANGYNTYTLDSIQPKVTAGTALPKIKLSVYESKIALGGFDPATVFQQPLKYYSNQQVDFDSNHGSTRLNDDDTNAYVRTSTNGPITDNSQNDQFVFNESEIQFYKRIDATTPGYTDVASRKAPGMYLNLNKAFFQSKIMNEIITPTGKLFNNSTFQDYFKGLYFKAESASATEGSLALMNFSAGYIKLIYTDDLSSTDHTRVKQEIKINLSGNTVNLLENDNNYPGYVSPNTTTGDSKLYLKGGNGSMAVIDLFGGQKNNFLNTDLQKMRDENWLINEANLTFYIDQGTMGTDADEPNRIYLYDLTNKRPLVDFYTDYSTNAITKFNKLAFGGILLDGNSKIVNQKNHERGTKYKINITNYLRTLVKHGPTFNSDKTAYLNSDGTAYTSIKDSTNVRLGLVVTENINTSGGNYYLKNPFTTTSSSNTLTSQYIPQMSVINPLGTILYGSNPSVPIDKRLKLEVYYTKPN
ncbi:MAG: DUF4270 domain-containing protein [Flavobacterium sp.]